MENHGEPGGHYATWLPQLAESFENATGVEIIWVTLSTAVREAQVMEGWSQKFHILPTSTNKRASTLFREDRKHINKVLDEFQPDLVHGWGTEDVYGLAAVTSGFRSLVSLQGILSYYALRNRMHPREYLQAALEVFVLNRSDRLTTESAWGKNILHKIAPSKPIDLVEYGVQYHFLNCQWMPDPSKPSAIFIGSVTPRKGIQDAVAAFRDSRLKSAELWVVGGDEGKWAAELRASSPANVRWFGRQSPDETARLLSRAWCLVLPTRADTSPNVVKEARVIGLPVICSPHGGHTTYIQDGQAGFVVPNKAIGPLADACVRVLSELAAAKQHGRQLLAEHRHQLHPARTAEGFLRIYQETKR